MVLRRRRCLLALAAPLLGGAEGKAEADTARAALSPAQRALFETPHLAALRPPLRLDYDFRREEDGKAPVADTIRLARPRLQRRRGGEARRVAGIPFRPARHPLPAGPRVRRQPVAALRARPRHEGVDTGTSAGTPVTCCGRAPPRMTRWRRTPAARRTSHFTASKAQAARTIGRSVAVTSTEAVPCESCGGRAVVIRLTRISPGGRSPSYRPTICSSGFSLASGGARRRVGAARSAPRPSGRRRWDRRPPAGAGLLPQSG